MEKVESCYVDRAGLIGFAEKSPVGTLRLARADAALLRQVVEPIARLAYDNASLLCPGIPEAATDEQAVAAAREMQRQIELGLQRAHFDRKLEAAFADIEFEPLLYAVVRGGFAFSHTADEVPIGALIASQEQVELLDELDLASVSRTGRLWPTELGRRIWSEHRLRRKP